MLTTPSSDTFTLSKDARHQHPYQSLVAAVLFQGLRDAMDEATDSMTAAEANGRTADTSSTAPIPAGQGTRTDSLATVGA